MRMLINWITLINKLGNFKNSFSSKDAKKSEWAATETQIHNIRKKQTHQWEKGKIVKQDFCKSG